MASKEGSNFTQSVAVLLYGDVRDAIPGNPSPPEARLAAEQSRLLLGAKDFMAVYEEKRVVLDIDLNVSLTADEDVEFPEVKHGGREENCSESWPEAAENVCDNRAEAHCLEIKEIGSVRKKDLRYNNRQWEALLEAAEMASSEYEECPRKGERKISEIGQRNQNDDEGSTAAEVAPPALRLRRERAAALPNKYRDSVLDYTVEAAIIATKLKFCR